MEYFGLGTGAFSQLTRKFMQEEFNDKTPNVDGTRLVETRAELHASVLNHYRYYSYGASLEPSSWSVFAMSHSIIKEMEGDLNDGLVRYSRPDRYSIPPC